MINDTITPQTKETVSDFNLGVSQLTGPIIEMKDQGTNTDFNLGLVQRGHVQMKDQGTTTEVNIHPKAEVELIQKQRM